MLERLVPTGYVSGAKDLLDGVRLFPAISGSPSDDEELFDSSDEDESDSGDEGLAPPDNKRGRGRRGRSGGHGGRGGGGGGSHGGNGGNGQGQQVSPNRSRSSSRLTDAYSDALDSDEETSSSSDENELDNGDFDEDEDDYSGYDGKNDADAFEPVRGLKPASTQAYKEFRRAFSAAELPETETLYKAYSCAFSKDILYQGKMYVTSHFLCFVSKFFGVTTTKLVIPLSSITKIEPKMMMNFIPNSIAIHTTDDRRYTFASFTNRNRTMGFLRKLRNSRVVALSAGATPNGALDAEAGQGPARPLTFTHDTRARSSTLPAMVRSPSDAANFAASSLTPNASDSERAFSGGRHMAGDTSRPGSRSPSRTASAFDVHAGANGYASGGAFASGGATDDPAAAAANGTGAGAGADAQQHFGQSQFGPAGAQSGGQAQPGQPSQQQGDQPQQHARTELPELAENEKMLVNETVAAPVGVVANILFGKDTTWMRHFLVDVEKNRDLRALPPFADQRKGAERSYEYIKPLHGPVGPKQTKCNCTERIDAWDYNSHIDVITTTATPDVPSGSSFTTLTRTVLAWGDNNSTQIRIGTWLEWTGKTWLKGPIEKGAIDGQTSSSKSLVAELGRKVAGARPDNSPKPRVPLRPASDDVEKEHVAERKHQRKSSTAKRAAKAIREWQQLCALLGIIVFVLLIVLLIVWRRSRAPATLTREQKLNLLRIEQELELWQWIDDRKDPAGSKRRALANANIDEALAVVERRVASLKASLM